MNIFATMTGIYATTYEFWSCLRYFLKGGKLESCPHFPKSLRARVQLKSLALISELWGKPHYRNGTFQDDMQKTLRNVAIPGTGIPLSVFCISRYVAIGCLLVLLPIVCLIAAIHEQYYIVKKGAFWGRVCSSYRAHLVEPSDWFSFWRLNCRLATFHASVTKHRDYRIEDKWDFLILGRDVSVPVTPWLDIGSLICKHRNEEGGLGIYTFSNSCRGGDWIIQEKLQNAPSLLALLPPNAPLSTLRVISSSTGGLSHPSYCLHQTTSSSHWTPTMYTHAAVDNPTVKVLSCVWRAGLANAETDHSGILFDVDIETGVIGNGVSSQHWYQIGVSKFFVSPWTSAPSVSNHPETNVKITGSRIAQMEEIVGLVKRAHTKMAPSVPLVGWDVAITPQGLFLLEANLSCNFFRGTFDEEAYFSFIYSYFVDLENTPVGS